MFGKVMSISDELMWRYFQLLSFRPRAEIEKWQQECADGANPRNFKVSLGQEIVARFHGEQAAKTALENFEARFQRGAIPDDLPEIQLTAEAGGIAIDNLLKQAGLVESTSEALRQIKQGAVKIDGEKLEDPKAVIAVSSQHVYQVGKRKFARVEIIS
jgi:tyrosyl-tRNA synthetase